MSGYRAAAVIASKLTLATSLLFLPHTATARADIAPPCDQPDATLCSWTINVDGNEVDVKGCAHEDGNEDGMPCLWRDPDGGAMYYVDSANYRAVRP